MMYDAIKMFPEQFSYEPIVEGAKQLVKKSSYVVTGMGGSHLAADLLKAWKPSIDCVIHKDYGLPAFEDENLSKRLIILSSYSGNTEEVLDAFELAGKKGFARAAVSVGGTLLERARAGGVPYIQMPDTGIQPRSALGYSIKALLKLVGEEDAVRQIGSLANDLDSAGAETTGKQLAETLRGHVPVIYSSFRNEAVAYNWKIKLNETGKTPAFYNMLPELNHNEMTGFDVKESTVSLSKNFHFILLKDSEDHPYIAKRMGVLKRLYEDRNFPVTEVPLEGKDRFHRMFSSLVLADWTAYYTAEGYGVEAEQVPMVEEFKRLIASS